MKSKRFMGIIAVVLCAVLMMSITASAVELRYDETEQRWRDLEVQRVPWRTGNDPNNDYYGTNCFAFVKWVIEYEGRGTMTSYINYGRELYVYTGGTQIAQQFNNNDTPITTSTVRAAFQNAKPGDVVQMRWKYNKETQHTALINGFDNDGVYFFQSHVSGQDASGWDVKEIKNSYYSYDTLAQRYTNPGEYGGFTIYRFGEEITPPKITDTPVASIVAGQYFSYQCKADGSVSSWSINGTLPSGLTINSSTGLISGTVNSTATGIISRYSRTYSFSVVASNSAGSNSQSGFMSVYEPPEFITTSLPDGEANKYYSQEIKAYGTESSMNWQVISGTLPPGLKFNASRNSRTATISGTPTTPGSYRFTIQLYNFIGNSETTASQTYNIKIDGLVPEPNMWTSGSFKGGKIGEYTSGTVKLYFRSMAYLSRWMMQGRSVSIVEGSLPPGMRLSWASANSGIDNYAYSNIYLSGTPSREGMYSFTIRAVNGYGGYTDSKQTVSISLKRNNAWADPDMGTYYVFPKGKRGVTYSEWVYVYGGTSPYTVTQTSGILPPGLSLYNYGRFIELYGRPTKYGTYTFTLRVTGAHNGYVDKTFTMTIASNSAYERASASTDDPAHPTKPKLATKKIPNAVVYSEYNVPFEAGGTKPITWTCSGDLPEGFTFTDTGVLLGVPTEEGKYKFKITAANSQGSVSKTFTLKVLPNKPLITTVEIPEGAEGQPYSFTLNAEGESIKWSKSGKFPKGLKLDKTTGEISGTPTTAGTYNFKITAKNKAGKHRAEFQIIINENPESSSTTSSNNIQSSSLPAAVNAVSHSAEALNITELYLLNNGQETDEDATVNAGTPLTFRVGDIDDDDDDENSIDFSDMKVFVNDEEVHGAAVAEDGTFTLPGELVNGSFTVYAGSSELETHEIEITAASTAQDDSSAGCNANFTGIFLLLIGGIALMKRK